MHSPSGITGGRVRYSRKSSTVGRSSTRRTSSQPHRRAIALALEVFAGLLFAVLGAVQVTSPRGLAGGTAVPFQLSMISVGSGASANARDMHPAVAAPGERPLEAADRVALMSVARGRRSHPRRRRSCSRRRCRSRRRSARRDRSPRRHGSRRLRHRRRLRAKRNRGLWPIRPGGRSTATRGRRPSASRERRAVLARCLPYAGVHAHDNRSRSVSGCHSVAPLCLRGRPPRTRPVMCGRHRCRDRCGLGATVAW
jgi:hypothetical protein